MNRFTIYQVKEEHIREYGYASMRELLWTHHAEAVEGRELYRLPREAWEPVYTWESEKLPSLDWLFDLFNRHSRTSASLPATPEDFHGHSMSVSDIIEYPDGRLWFCDSLGWKEIEWASPEESAQSPAQRVCAEEDEHRSERAFEPARKRDDAEIVRTT